tara:strand:+ start:1889 stop:3139 length:1251 start_codon:yes stop_codon:yes gene_type:complete
MGLLQQNQRQKYQSKKKFTADGTVTKFQVSNLLATFNAAHQGIYQQIINAGVASDLTNKYVKVYLNGDLYAAKVILDTSTPASITYDKRYDFRFDNNDGWIIEFANNHIPANATIIDVHIDQSVWQDSTGTTHLTTNNYQVTSLEDVISNFMIAYTGEDKVLNKAKRTDVQFHAMRALQELSFDTFKSCKSMELEVPPSLVLPLPHDYVNYVKLSWKDSSGIKRPIYPTNNTSNPIPYRQDADGNIEFDANSTSEFSDVNNVISDKDSDTWTSYSSAIPSEVQDDYQDDTYWPNAGQRYGLESKEANVNGVYFIDCARHMINFSSNLNGNTIILDYISDSLGTDGEMVVHKMAEEAMYKWIMYGLLSTRSNIPEQIVQRYKKERFAETRKAKLRLSNIKLEEITQVLRGKSKFIKH